MPGVKAWQHHHKATMNFVRQHRVRQQKKADDAKIVTSAEEEEEEDQQQQQQQGGGNPVGRIWASLMNRPKLVSSCSEWKRLQKHAEYIETTHLSDFLQDAERCDAMYALHDGVYLDYSRQRVTPDTMKFLYDLAEKQDLAGKIKAMVSGEKINFTEDRAVLHTALRADRSEIGTIMVDGMDVVQEVHDVLIRSRNLLMVCDRERFVGTRENDCATLFLWALVGRTLDRNFFTSASRRNQKASIQHLDTAFDSLAM
jgi:glucose-6-phosphate isomerase